MLFLHCPQCDATTRILQPSAAGVRPGEWLRLLRLVTLHHETDPELGAFCATHANCPVLIHPPTGRTAASGPWHEPLTERRIEVETDCGLAVAVGRRQSIDFPVTWRIEPGTLDEIVSIELDREEFEDTIDRALFPNHLPNRAIAAWATAIERMLANARPEELTILHDDARRPNRSRVAPSDALRQALAALSAVGFDPETSRRLRSLFSLDAEFPPLWIKRSTPIDSPQSLI